MLKYILTIIILQLQFAKVHTPFHHFTTTICSSTYYLSSFYSCNALKYILPAIILQLLCASQSTYSLFIILQLLCAKVHTHFHHFTAAMCQSTYSLSSFYSCYVPKYILPFIILQLQCAQVNSPFHYCTAVICSSLYFLHH